MTNARAAVILMNAIRHLECAARDGFYTMTNDAYAANDYAIVILHNRLTILCQEHTS